MTEIVDIAIIGGGHAGLAMSYWLREHRREHVILERDQVGARWRSERWDSFTLQSPNWDRELPGAPYEGDAPDGFSTRDEIVSFLTGYAERIEAPVRLGVDVISVRPSRSVDSRWQLRTSVGDIGARSVIVATGPYQRPVIPALATGLDPSITQLTPSSYRRPDQLDEGAVLVVGSGSSGCQIAEELHRAGRPVYLSVSAHHRVPRRYRGRDFKWWWTLFGEPDKVVDQAEVDGAGSEPALLLTGADGGHDVDLHALESAGVVLLGRVVGIDRTVVELADDLRANLERGDAMYDRFLWVADHYERERKLGLPVDERPPRSSPRPRPVEDLRTLDLAAAGVRTVVWACGFDVDFRWIEASVFDSSGRPIHHRGVTAAPGLYFLGLPWLHKLKSSWIPGVGEDAAYLAAHLQGMVPDAYVSQHLEAISRRQTRSATPTGEQQVPV
jgi:putative flavoprotein involved in K+ transport